MARYHKVLAALAGAVVSLLTAGVLPDPADRWAPVVVAFLTAAGVYAAPPNAAG